MLNSFTEYFNDRYELFLNRRLKGEFRYVDLFVYDDFPKKPGIAKFIEQITSESGKHWRPDAKLFLGINVIENIVMPLYMSENVLTLDDVVLNLVKEDIEMIVKSANDVSVERDRNYVSGTSALVGTARVIDKLLTTKMSIWGSSHNEEDAVQSLSLIHI